MRHDRQQGQVPHMLQVNPEGVCASTFRAKHIPRYSARLTELRKKYNITRVACPYAQHHHVTHHFAWKLDVDGQSSMF